MLKDQLMSKQQDCSLARGSNCVSYTHDKGQRVPLPNTGIGFFPKAREWVHLADSGKTKSGMMNIPGNTDALWQHQKSRKDFPSGLGIRKWWLSCSNNVSAKRKEQQLSAIALANYLGHNWKRQAHQVWDGVWAWNHRNLLEKFKEFLVHQLWYIRITCVPKTSMKNGTGEMQPDPTHDITLPLRGTGRYLPTASHFTACNKQNTDNLHSASF